MIGSMPVEELSYGLDVAGVDPAALGEAVRAVVSDVMSDPLRLTAPVLIPIRAPRVARG